MEFKFNQTLPGDYASLLERSGNMKHSALAITKAIKNSLFTVGIYEGEELIAFGRVTGDDALCYIICDIMVDEKLADRNLEAMIFKELDDYIRAVNTKDSQTILIADKKVGELARKFRYMYFDSDFYAIMKR